MRHALRTCGLLMVLTLFLPSPAKAQLETLVMPGEVIEAHAEYEKECSNCHLRFERSKQ